MQVFLRPGDRDVEQPGLVGLGAPVPVRVRHGRLGITWKTFSPPWRLDGNRFFRSAGTNTAGHCIPLAWWTVAIVTASGVAYPASASLSA